jgi:hypothetical protein
LISGFVEFFVVLIHRFVVLGVDLHFHKFSSPNSLYFGRNRRFYLPICAQIDEFFAQYPVPAKAGLHTGNSQTVSKFLDSKSSEPAKAGPSSAKAGSAYLLQSTPHSSLTITKLPTPAPAHRAFPSFKPPAAAPPQTATAVLA